MEKDEPPPFDGQEAPSYHKDDEGEMKDNKNVSRYYSEHV